MTHIFLNLIIVILYILSLYDIRKGFSFFMAGLFLQGLFLLYRTIYLGHLPVTDRYDILLMIGLSTALLILLFPGEIDSESIYLRLVPAGFAFLSVFYERINTISPNMNSIWFYLHSSLFIIAFSLFSIGSATGFIYLKTQDEKFESLLLPSGCLYYSTHSEAFFFILSLMSSSACF